MTAPAALAHEWTRPRTATHHGKTQTCIRCGKERYSYDKCSKTLFCHDEEPCPKRAALPARCCGTCAWWAREQNPLPGLVLSDGDCSAPIPWSAHMGYERNMTFEDDGDDCPCWKERE